ncbi:phenylalanine--tRNA ligase beta subunit [Planctomycetota bacterium]|nr:phenylalanine--tRNA ligase beta subunit [Planctomycetota bacterium]
MRISLSWVRRLLGVERLPIPTPELQARLTLRTAEVEPDIQRIGPNLAGVVVGKVRTCAPHPAADRLRCTTVDLGDGTPVPIVCGAPNVAAGQTVAVATIGSTLTVPGKDGTPTTITIKAAKLRGEPSQGMICAEDELGLGPNHDGILVLPDHLTAGTPLAVALGLGDEVLIVENIAVTHRPDLWSMWGWSREIAALCGLPPPPALDLHWSDLGAGPQAPSWSVELLDNDGRAYAGAVVEGVSNGESPAWLRNLLESVGVRPLGILVDVTNLVCWELGQPMHAFDRARLAGTTLQVRAALAGERLTTLDGKERPLTTADLVIADAAGPQALAGIMGGAAAAVSASTTAVVLESASFGPTQIRRCRQRHGLASDSSARFEKDLPVELLPAAIHRAVALLAELCPGSRVVQRFHAGALTGTDRRLAFDPAEPGRVLGIPLPAADATQYLESLGFIDVGGMVQVPWWRRRDVQRACDLVEEAARCHGYDRIVSAAPRLPAAVPPAHPLRTSAHQARRTLSALGWDEVATDAFTSAAWAGAMGWDATTRIDLAHPMSSAETILRAHPLPTLLEAIGRNRKHLDRVRLHEIATIYAAGTGTDPTPDERMVVAGCVAETGNETPFFAARDAALDLLAGLGFAAQAVAGPTAAAIHGLVPSRTVTLHVAGLAVGVAGEVIADHRQRADCPERVGFFLVELERMVAARGAAPPVRLRMPSRFPAVDRDFTWECAEDLPFARLADATRGAAGDIAAGLDLVTIYRGPPYAEGRKAVSLRLTLQAADRTLTEAELERTQHLVTTAVAKATGAILRG